MPVAAPGVDLHAHLEAAGQRLGGQVHLPRQVRVLLQDLGQALAAVDALGGLPLDHLGDHDAGPVEALLQQEAAPASTTGDTGCPGRVDPQPAARRQHEAQLGCGPHHLGHQPLHAGVEREQVSTHARQGHRGGLSQLAQGQPRRPAQLQVLLRQRQFLQERPREGVDAGAAQELPQASFALVQIGVLEARAPLGLVQPRTEHRLEPVLLLRDRDRPHAPQVDLGALHGIRRTGLLLRRRGAGRS